MSTAPVPLRITQEVERFVTKLHDDAEKASNVELLDDGQIYELHMRVAEIYQAGYQHGLDAQMERDRYARSREFDRQRAAAKESSDD